MIQLVVVLAACSGRTPPPDDTDVELEPAADGLDGVIPYVFPVVRTNAAAGDFVLAPSRESLDRALLEGGAVATYVWHGAILVEPGATESRLRSLAGDEYVLPNALILPIPRGATAAPGELLLGHGESSSGLQRAVVVGGTPAEPVVRYLDLALDDPSGAGADEDTWEPDRFAPLVQGAPGVTTACRRGGEVHHGVLVAFANHRALTLERGGHLFANAAADCIPLDPKPVVAPGDEVQVPRAGVYTAATVTRVDEAIGRVFVDLEGVEVGVARVDVAPTLEGFGRGYVGGGLAAEEPVPPRSGNAGKRPHGGKAKGRGRRKGGKTPPR